MVLLPSRGLPCQSRQRRTHHTTGVLMLAARAILLACGLTAAFVTQKDVQKGVMMHETAETEGDFEMGSVVVHRGELPIHLLRLPGQRPADEQLRVL